MIKGVEDLLRAYRRGELDRTENKLILDNDSVVIYKDDVQMFSLDPYQLLRDLLDACDLPWDEA